jgi:2,4-dienoyl-CoA reductase-like NADH-dependent reductase (Old Yellow Enzyme family)/NADPH-dependent 2,4-dienoyl-CoA reductase/sulfur reductase-like enzyme
MKKGGKYKHLFNPGKIGSLVVPNRIVMAPMATNYPSETGGMTEVLVDYYEQRAKGGVGLIIAENCCVDYPAGKGGATQIRLDEDRFIPGISRLVEAVHCWGAKISIQINHSGPSGAPAKTEGKGPVGASPVTYGPHMVPPRALEGDEIEAIIEKYAQAVLRAKKANFDAIELHGAHGYLLAHFMSPFTNKRTDEYGGDVEGRLRMVIGVIRRVRELVGDEYPLMFRMSADEFVDGGRGLEESKHMAAILAAEGIDALHVSAGTHPAMHPSGTLSIEPMAYEQGWRVYLAEEVKKAVDLPVIAIGVIRDPDFAEEVLARGRADFVALGRGLIADPEWANKARNGREKSIRKCISCNEGCIRRRGFMDLPIRCTVNAEVGKSPRFRASPITGNPKRVLVIGGGPGGMEAARVLKLRGHDVTLWERGKVLGGQLVFAGIPPFKRKLHWFLDYLRRQMDELSIAYDLGREATRKSILDFGPDELILATGAVPVVPPISGVDGPYVKAPEDVLVEDYSGSGSQVVVMGGGAKGAEVGLFLSERGESVTIVEMLDGISLDMDPISRKDLLSRLEERNVTLLTRARIVSCGDNGVTVELDGDKNAVIEGEKLILSLGYQPVNELEEDLKEEVSRVHCIGDCREARKAIDAVSEAYTVATQI